MSSIPGVDTVFDYVFGWVQPYHLEDFLWYGSVWNYFEDFENRV